MDILRGILGITFIIIVAFLFSERKKNIPWKTVCIGIGIQILLAVVIINPLEVSILEYFRKGFDWIGVKGASTHSFRRSMATNLMNNSFTLKEIMDITGHKNISTLQEYLDTDKKTTHSKYKQLISGVTL